MEIKSFGESRAIILKGGHSVTEAVMVDSIVKGGKSRLTPKQVSDVVACLIDAYETKLYLYRNVSTKKAPKPNRLGEEILDLISAV